jgi:hypothetical protein
MMPRRSNKHEPEPCRGNPRFVQLVPGPELRRRTNTQSRPPGSCIASGLPVGGSRPQTLALLERIAIAVENLAADAHRLADHFSPAPGDIVGTPYLADQLGCTVVWAAEMARKGEIPKSCIVPGTGNGKPWKFYRGRIEEWLNKR